MNTAALTTTRKAARQARNAQVDRIAARFGALYRERVKLFAQQAEPLFQACKAGCWGPVELRDARKLDELRQITASFARDVAVIVQDRALAARRLGGAQGFAAAGVVNAVQERVVAREADSYFKDCPRVPAGGEPHPGACAASDGGGSAKTDSPEFKRWFGDSKVVDDDGKPLVVYRGADASNEAIGAPSWFTTSNETADEYAGVRNPVTGEDEEPRKPGAHVTPAYLSIRNPYKADFAEIANATQSTIDRLTAKGYDGMVRINDRTKERWYVPFDVRQVKSKFNRGTFDPNSPRISESESLTPVANVSIGKRPTARVVIVENGLVWAVQPKHEAVWTLPGGGVDPGEPYDIAAIREAKEEVGFDVEVVEALFDVEEPGRCGACRALVDMGYLEAGHPGCHRRYFHARRVGNESEPTITDTDEIARVMLVSSTSLNDPHDRIAAEMAVASQPEDPTRKRDAFRTQDDMGVND